MSLLNVYATLTTLHCLIHRNVCRSNRPLSYHYTSLVSLFNDLFVWKRRQNCYQIHWRFAYKSGNLLEWLKISHRLSQITCRVCEWPSVEINTPPGDQISWLFLVVVLVAVVDMVVVVVVVVMTTMVVRCRSLWPRCVADPVSGIVICR